MEIGWSYTVHEKEQTTQTSDGWEAQGERRQSNSRGNENKPF